MLSVTQAPFADVDFDTSAAQTGPRDFSAVIDRTLLDGTGRDIYIYVHGYKVVFENAIAVSTELWHYLNYEGAFIAFSWPATPRRTAYFGDLETAEMAAVVLRRFLTYLSNETRARRIHLVGYSAGTRVITAALTGLALSQRAESLARMLGVRAHRTSRPDRQRHGSSTAGSPALRWHLGFGGWPHGVCLLQRQSAHHGTATSWTRSSWRGLQAGPAATDRQGVASPHIRIFR